MGSQLVHMLRLSWKNSGILRAMSEFRPWIRLSVPIPSKPFKTVSVGARSFQRLTDSIKVARSADDLILFFDDLDALKDHGEIYFFNSNMIFDSIGLNRLDDTVLQSMGCDWTRVEFVGMGVFSYAIVTPVFMTVKSLPGLLLLVNWRLSEYLKGHVEVRTSQFDIHRACQEWLRKLSIFQTQPELLITGEAAMKLCGQRLSWGVEDVKRVVLRSKGVLVFLSLQEQVHIVYHVAAHGPAALNSKHVSDLEWTQWWLRPDAAEVSRAGLANKSLVTEVNTELPVSNKCTNVKILLRLFLGLSQFSEPDTSKL